jgi:KamA family protein
LTLVDESLGRLVAQLRGVSHLKRIRIHTRLPVMIPQRVTEKLLDMFSDQHRQQTVMVIHSNHANELDATVHEALRKIAAAGITLLNQSVLLRGVNDSAEALVALSERLLECGVLPYYLHKNDPIIGTAHFEVSVERGIELINALRAVLPGYAVPRFVQEIAGQPNKTVLA